MGATTTAILIPFEVGYAILFFAGCFLFIVMLLIYLFWPTREAGRNL